MTEALLRVEGLTKDFPVGGGFMHGARPLRANKSGLTSEPTS